MKRYSALAFVLLLSGAAQAADDTASSYELGESDRTAMSDGANSYNACLHEKSEPLLETVEDIRQIAGEAMQQCDSILLDLDKSLTEKGVAEGFRLGYLRHTRNSAVNRLLPELMARRGSIDAATAE